MKYNITFRQSGSSGLLPFDYQYYTGAWIYRVLRSADSRYAEFLHEQGYASGAVSFKYFCYSPLSFSKAVFHRKAATLEVAAGAVQLQVAFLRETASQIFLRGLLRQQRVFIGNRKCGLSLLVDSIEEIQPPQFSPHMHYTTLSPVVVSCSRGFSCSSRYLSPCDTDYASLIRGNLLKKAAQLYDPALQKPEIEFRITSPAQQHLVTIKAGTGHESKIKAFSYCFNLSAPPGIQELLWHCGLGGKNSTGFGYCRSLVES